MRAVIIIPARLASTRLSRKVLLPIGGLPMVVRTYRRARLCPLVQEVIVATDSEEVVLVAQAHGIAARLTRVEHASGSDRVAEVARDLDADVVLNLQADEPFVEPLDLTALVHALDAGADIATLSAPILDTRDYLDPNVVKVVTADSGQALYFSRAPIPHGAQAHDETPSHRHIGVYGFRKAALLEVTSLPRSALEETERLEQLRWLAAGFRIQVVRTENQYLGIDTPEDLERAELLC